MCTEHSCDVEGGGTQCALLVAEWRHHQEQGAEQLCEQEEQLKFQSLPDRHITTVKCTTGRAIYHPFALYFRLCPFLLLHVISLDEIDICLLLPEINELILML